jgi:mono/diheme cytochrome c family protein
VLALQKDNAADVQIQLALSLAKAEGDAGVKEALSELSRSANALVKSAALFSVAARAPVPAPIVTAKSNGPPMSPEHQKRFEAGKAVYEATCIACHQVHGLGQEGLAPPLVGSDWIAGPDKRLARIVLNGLRGPIKVRGQKWDMDMPSLGVLEDQQIADILTYVRREWGHSFDAVSVETVRTARKEVGEREDSWTADELLKIK